MGSEDERTVAESIGKVLPNWDRIAQLFSIRLCLLRIAAEACA